MTTETQIDVAVPDPRAPHLPADPRGLVDLARFFDAKGHERLARYLRACADHIAMASQPEVTTAVLTAKAYHVDPGFPTRDSFVQPRVALYMGGDPELVHAVRLGRDYALIEVPTRAIQETEHATSD